MTKVMLLRDDSVDPKKLMRALAPLALPDDQDALDMARKGDFSDPIFDELQIGVLDEDLDSLAISLSAYLPNEGYSVVRQKMLDVIGSASEIFLKRPNGGLNDIERLMNRIIGDARLDRWVGYYLLRIELERFEETMSKPDRRRIESWLRAAKNTAETGYTTKPSVIFNEKDRRRAENDADGEAISLGRMVYRVADNTVLAATQNAWATIANRMIDEVADPEWDNLRYSERRAILMQSLAPMISDAIRSFPPRRQ